jgi:hypothetical protein
MRGGEGSVEDLSAKTPFDCPKPQDNTDVRVSLQESSIPPDKQ